MAKIINSFWDYITGFNREGPLASNTVVPDDYSVLYDALYDLYNNDAGLSETDSSRRLRTVVNRSVEFYASKMLPGDKVTVIPANGKQQTQVALETVLKLSNFQGNKPAMLRNFALYGDSFVRVRGDKDKVYLEDISPFYVTDFGEDSRGFLTYIRIDIPILGENRNPLLYTEYWDLETQTYRSWISMNSASTPIANFGTPQETVTFSELGVDFIPIVHTKFKDTGDARGKSCVYHALDKIIEANRMATRLNDMQFRFNKPLFAVSANAKDPQGRPLPAPKIDTGTTGTASAAEESKESILGDTIYLPGESKLDSLVPNINYADGLAILNAQMDELEQDLPELRYYSIQDSQLSGKAIRLLLGAAIDRAEEARNNFIAGLTKMLEMGMTIGIFYGIFPSTLGTYDNGDFELTIQLDTMFGESLDERATTLKMLTDAGVPLSIAMKKVGFSDDEIAQAMAEKQASEAARAATFAQSVMNFNRQ